MSISTTPVAITSDGRRSLTHGNHGSDRDRRRGSVALVTGAGRGVGQRVAIAFAEAGAAVALVARSETELTGTVGIIEAAGGTAAALAADVTDATGTAAAVADLRRRLGPFDLLIRIAAGDGDGLSGRHLSVHHDLDAVLARLAEVRDRDLYVLRPEPLSNLGAAQ